MSSKNYLLTALSSLLLCVSCNIGPKGPYFWKAEKEGQSLYILGTFHFGVKLEELQCSDTISNTLDQSSLVWTEGDLWEGTRSIIEMTEILMTDTSGQNFQSLNKETQDFFINNTEGAKKLSYFGLISELSNMCLTKHVEWLKEQAKNQKKEMVMLDAQIQQLANTKNIPQNYLDNSDYLANLLQQNVQQITKEQIEKAVKNYNKDCTQDKIEKVIIQTNNLLNEILTKYKKGEAVDFSNLMKLQLQQVESGGITNDDIEDAVGNFDLNILKKRNEIWTQKLHSTHKAKQHNSMFVAAGLAHFTGNHNVLDMLEKEGFSVQRFNSQCELE